VCISTGWCQDELPYIPLQSVLEVVAYFTRHTRPCYQLNTNAQPTVNPGAEAVGVYLM